MSETQFVVMFIVFLFGFGMGGNLMRWSMIQAGWKKPGAALNE